MAGEQIITWVGNLTDDPEFRSTSGGQNVSNFTLASTPRNFDRAANEWKDGETSFLRCSAWRETAEHIQASLKKGMRVIAQGRLRMRKYQDSQGQERTAWELEVDEIGPALRYATAQVTRAGNTQGGGQPQQQGGAYGPPQGAYGPPQGAYGAPQQPMQQGGYPAPPQQQPMQQAPVQQQPMQQPMQPQQPQQPQQQPQQQFQQPQQQAPVQQPQQQTMQQAPGQMPQPGAFQSPGDWAQPGGFQDQKPF